MFRPGRSVRKDFDYAIYHKTGEKVPIDRGSKMADLKTQVIHIQSDVEDFFDSYDIYLLDDEDELYDYVTKLGEIKRDFRRIYTELKTLEGENFTTNHPDLERSLYELTETFKNANKRLTDRKKLKKQTELERLENEAYDRKVAEERRLSEEKFAEERRMDELMNCAENLHFEIDVRYKTFTKKCKIDVTELSDHEILDLKKREDNLHTELRELIDKVSAFEKFILPCGEVARELRADVVKMRNSCSIILEDFLDTVADAIKTRDISDKKLEKSAGLDIKLSKFKGHHSEMDIYTFRAEFRKLIEPSVRRGLLADYLKKNYLEGPAHNLVSKIEGIDDIWKKLVEVYGDTRLLLQNKLSSLEKFSKLEKLTDDEKIAFTITSLLNAMTDLTKLAEENDLEGELYHGGGVVKILELMGKQRERKFIKSTARARLSNPEKWKKLVTFLENEREEREAFVLNEKVRKTMYVDKKPNDKGNDSKKGGGPKSDSYVSNPPVPKCKCYICGKDEDHVLSKDSDNKPCVEYIACKDFVNMTTKERDNILFKKRLCSKCLKPGTKFNSDHTCDKQYACGQPFTNRQGEEKICEKHVLVCHFHCEVQKNKEILELYKTNVIKSHGKYFDFSKEIAITCFSEAYNLDYNSDVGYKSDVTEASIFAFQTIDISGLRVNIFYDSGCGDFIVRKSCAEKLSQIARAGQLQKGPIVLNGVNNQESICKHGIYGVRLPLKKGHSKANAEMIGICVDEITIPFPKYPLQVVEQDIIKEVGLTNKSMLPNLPRLPNEVGGEVDIMIGKAYLKYFPIDLIRLESGLTLSQSMFESPDGSTGVVCGPHPEFSKTERSAHFALDRKLSYLSEPVQRYFECASLREDMPLIGLKKSSADPELVQLIPKDNCAGYEVDSPKLSGDNIGDLFAGESSVDPYVYKVGTRPPKCLKNFEVLEKTGTEISYRCMDCRNCQECKKGVLVEEISIREEYEQDLQQKCHCKYT